MFILLLNISMLRAWWSRLYSLLCCLWEGLWLSQTGSQTVCWNSSFREWHNVLSNHFWVGSKEKNPEGLTTKRGFACCQVAEGLWPTCKWDCGFFFPVMQKHLKKGFHFQFKVHFGTSSRTDSINLSVLT